MVVGVLPKPGRSASRLYDPAWSWARQHLTFALPFWEGTGNTVFDLISGAKLTAAGTANPGIDTWSYADNPGYDPQGMSATIDGHDRLETDYDPVVTGPFSLFIRFHGRSSSQVYDWIGAVAEKGSNDPTILLRHTPSAQNLFVRDLDGGSTGFQAFHLAAEYVKGVPHNVLLTRTSDGTIKCWLDENRVFTSSTGLVSGTIDLSGNPFYIFARNSRGVPTEDGARGGLSALYFWDGMEGTDEIALRLSIDPWGPVRIADEVGVVYALPAGGGQFIAVGTLAETDSPVAIPPVKPIDKAVGVLGETDALLPAAAVKVAPIGTLPETNALLPVRPRKIADIGTLEENDSLVAIAADKLIDKAVGILTEIESLVPIQARKIANIGTLIELNNLLAIAAVKPIIKLVGTFAEQNLLISVAVVQPGGQSIAVGTLIELDNLLSIAAQKIAQIGVLSENNALLPIAARKIFDIGTLLEVNALLALQAGKVADIATLGEINALQPIDPSKVAQIGTLSELESLVAVSALKLAQIGVLIELDSLIAIAADKPITVNVGTLAEIELLVQIIAEAGPDVLRKVTTFLQDGFLTGIAQKGHRGTVE